MSCVLLCAFIIQTSVTGDTVLHPQRDDGMISVLCAVESHTTDVRWATLLTDSTQRMNYT